MLRSGERIALTTPERQLLARLTGEEPPRVLRPEELEAFLRRHAARYGGDGPCACFARRLLGAFLP
ncbi:MAG: hypothetical protein D6809_00395 [Gammaproteobacteria bacterium]|nr:MAG: hypothetical protein D6809_00395 [Gammaproteobacteria bacterium]